MPSIQVYEEEGVRYLQFGAHWIQGAMRINRPWALELEYARDMMLPLLLRNSAWPRSVLTIGLGAGSITKFLYRYVSAAKLEVVEIDPEVLLTAWTFFRLPAESDRLRIEIGDGYEYVANTRSRYDLILLDGFDTNLVSRRGRPKDSIGRISRVFDGRVLVLPPNEANTIAIAAVGARIAASADQLRASARKLWASTGLDLSPTLARLDAGNLIL